MAVIKVTDADESDVDVRGISDMAPMAVASSSTAVGRGNSCRGCLSRVAKVAVVLLALIGVVVVGVLAVNDQARAAARCHLENTAFGSATACLQTDSGVAAGAGAGTEAGAKTEAKAGAKAEAEEALYSHTSILARLAQLELAKASAVEAENFTEAQRLKEEIGELAIKLYNAGGATPNSVRPASTQTTTTTAAVPTTNGDSAAASSSNDIPATALSTTTSTTHPSTTTTTAAPYPVYATPMTSPCYADYTPGPLSISSICCGQAGKHNRKDLDRSKSCPTWRRQCQGYTANVRMGVCVATDTDSEQPPTSPTSAPLATPTPVTYDTSCRKAYSSGTWAPSATPVVPGVPYGMDDTQHGDHLYFNSAGYSHCRNGQGKQWGTKLQTPAELKHVYTSGNSTCPYRMFSTEEARECLRGKWIHMNGDSLVRDQFFGRLADCVGFFVIRGVHDRVHRCVGLCWFIDANIVHVWKCGDSKILQRHSRSLIKPHHTPPCTYLHHTLTHHIAPIRARAIVLLQICWSSSERKSRALESSPTRTTSRSYQSSTCGSHSTL